MNHILFPESQLSGIVPAYGNLKGLPLDLQCCMMGWWLLYPYYALLASTTRDEQTL